jgi:hypothetical protein
MHMHPYPSTTAGGAEALLATGPLTRRTRQQLKLDADDLDVAIGGGVSPPNDF